MNDKTKESVTDVSLLKSEEAMIALRFLEARIGSPAHKGLKAIADGRAVVIAATDSDEAKAAPTAPDGARQDETDITRCALRGQIAALLNPIPTWAEKDALLSEIFVRIDLILKMADRAQAVTPEELAELRRDAGRWRVSRDCISFGETLEVGGRQAPVWYSNETADVQADKVYGAAALFTAMENSNGK